MKHRWAAMIAVGSVLSWAAACANNGSDETASQEDAGPPQQIPPSDAALADHTTTDDLDAGAEGGIIRCNESGWCFSDVPRRADFLEGVGGSGPNDVWAVGLSVDMLPLIIHWDGSAWAVSWVGTEPNGAVYAVWAPSKDEAWAVGNPGIMHYEAGAWTVVRKPDDETVGTDVWGASADDFWAVGSNGVTTGSPWSVQHAQRSADGGFTWTSHVLSADSYGASFVRGRTKDDVWFGSFQGLWHYVRSADGGSTWTKSDASGITGNLWVGTDGGLVSSDQHRILPDGGTALLPHDDAGRFDTHFVWGSGGSDLYFVGGSESATINHWDGTSVRFEHSLLNGAPVPGSFTSAWGSSSTDVWVVGVASYTGVTRGIALHRTGP